MNSPSPAGPAPAGHRNPHAAGLRHVLTHLVTPLLMCIGMGLAYLGAFANPSPHHLPVAVVGSGQSAQVLAQTLNDRSGGDLAVRTVTDRAQAVDQLRHQDIFGAYVMAAQPADAGKATDKGKVKGEAAEGAGAARGPELLVATAGSDTTASAVEKTFTPVAARQGQPLKITDVAPTAPDDPTGQGIFFLLVAISIGSYASVAVIGGAGSVLPMRLRALVAAGTSLVVSVIGVLLAGPVFHLVEHGLWGLWAMAWLYSAGILGIGIGLHTFLKRWTTLGVMALFVMLNFTSSGGVFRPELQNGFFAALHSFWNGAGFVEGVRSHVYFAGHGLAGHAVTLVLWLLVGAAMVAVAAAAEAGRRRSEEAATARAAAVAAAAVAATVPEPQPARPGGRGPHGTGATPAERAAEEEMEETVAV
ncbi:hypothetical protein C3486_06700 [Streptomyces sp. Ru73]|uniref:hypothetical protein n=1 Tax=Streptomyces sp. Ru73 TaxID=2080748 RepID=UPI000CDD6AE3|nr:hypothetical protein [Streptomyces sp. Ru73]POX42154.1 hypothetical protein C3486_06700 [Streptomyces sp. Ru73]